jgi:hypothetical protein
MKKRILIVADHAGWYGIPENTELLILDDFCKPVSQGYGGNRKIGFQYAIQNGFDIVAVLPHGGSCESLPELLEPLLQGDADAVFGTARTGGIVTKIQNLLLHTSLEDFRSGYRLYSVGALEQIPFERNTNARHFDTEIAIQLLRANLRIRELAVPGSFERASAWSAVMTTLRSRAQDFGILYQRKFDVEPATRANPLYQPKFTFESPHTLTLERVPTGSAVADVGCAAGYMSRALSAKHCRVTGIDQFPGSDLERFVQCDLDQANFPLDAGTFDYILLLDIIEHLRSPERFLDSLRQSRVAGNQVKVIMSTGNVAFIVTRLGLLFGWFNYGPRGILDLTHTRLFTFKTARALLEQSGYQIEEVRGVPAPWPLAFGDGLLARIALAVNKALIRISKPVFSYQIFIVCTPLPSLAWLLARAYASRKEKVQNTTT